MHIKRACTNIIHLGKPSTTTDKKGYALIKQRAANDHFKSAAVIAEEILQEIKKQCQKHPLRNWPRQRTDTGKG